MDQSTDISACDSFNVNDLNEIPTLENEHTVASASAGTDYSEAVFTETQVDDLSTIIMPSKIKKRGRTKGSEQTVIGLKKRRTIKIPTKFTLKSETMQKTQILREIVSNDDAIKQCLEGEYKIKNIDLKDFKCLRHVIFDPSFNLGLVKDLFELGAFENLIDFIEHNKENHEWCCATCNNAIAQLKSICCDSCLMWYHFRCVGLAKTPIRRTWFCRECY
ncbi:uncharacterized protein LOC116183037 [Photinus pyralis]|nr:uncharacterized protein LOC116183037 [Photinus pyralis]